MGECRRQLSRAVGDVSATELLPKSQPETARRANVSTGTGQRRSWTTDQKAQIIAEGSERP
jgi:hypothetical protein